MYHNVENFTEYFKLIKSNVKLIHVSISKFPWLQEKKLTHAIKHQIQCHFPCNFFFFLTEKSETKNNSSRGRKNKNIHYLLPDTFTGQEEN